MLKENTAATLRPASRRARSMPRSAIREIMALAAERADVIHLEVGEPDATTPQHIIEAAFQAARAGWTKYSSNAGLPALRQLIAQRVSRRWGTELAAGQVVVTTGAIGALYTAITTVVEAGDEIVIPDPGWPNYESIAHLIGATAVRYALQAKNGFLPDPDEVAAKLTARTKAILINTPGNPTGAVFPRELMARLAGIARARGLYLISDEIYEDIVFGGEHVSIGEFGLGAQAFVISGFSKSFAMTGWRLGWLVCPPELAAVATGLQEPLTSCASTIAQKAGEAALSGPQECVAAFRDTFRRRRDILVDVLGKSGLLPMVPEGAFYGLVEVSRTGLKSLEFAKRFLLERNVATVPGITFGPSCDRYVRVAFTIEDERLRDGLQRLRDFIEKPRG
jgi:aspartate/methionine/tyrosine aminotransferase